MDAMFFRDPCIRSADRGSRRVQRAERVESEQQVFLLKVGHQLR